MNYEKTIIIFYNCTFFGKVIKKERRIESVCVNSGIRKC